MSCLEVPDGVVINSVENSKKLAHESVRREGAYKSMPQLYKKRKRCLNWREGQLAAQNRSRIFASVPCTACP